MKKLVVTLALCSLVFSFGFQSTPVVAADTKIPVVVVDSGSDFTHELIKPRAYANEEELNGEVGVDDDGNGYKDDVYGWNFVDNSKTIVHLEYTPSNYDELLEFMKCMSLYQQGGRDNLTPEQFNFLVTHYRDKKFMKVVSFIGGWSHGTHVAGIIAQDNEVAHIKAITHIPSGQNPHAMFEHMLAPITLNAMMKGDSADRPAVSLEMFKREFKKMGEKSARECIPEAKYLASLNPRVINCSFGSSNQALFQSFKKNMVQNWGFVDPTDEEVQNLVNIFVENAMITRDIEFFKRVPNALIVIAAGNSSEDNDKLVISPNNMPFDNKLVVAATNQDKELAKFSCYGKTTVDVATPGVNIYSSYPNHKMGYMSGTSMAAPLAARYCAMTLAKNPKLTPVELKKTVMGTVDKKSWLKDKVVSGGVINVKRAMRAAELTAKGTSVSDAIRQARLEVKDETKASPFDLFKPVKFNSQFEKDLYFSTVF